MAAGYGQAYPDVLDWPWVDVVEAADALAEIERVKGLRRRGDAIELASLIRSAMYNGPGLERARERLRGDYRLPADVRRTVDPATAQREAQRRRRFERVLRIHDRKVTPRGV